MTTAATVMGHFPLVLAKGPGAGARNSIGIMLVTGMIIGSAFTLFVVPSIYVLLARTHTTESFVEASAPEAAKERLPLPVPVYQSAREAS
jgi:multidrug efflux pump